MGNRSAERGMWMQLLKSMLVALSTYSAIPVPQFPWEERHMRYAICWFPLVGVICGGLLLLWQWLCLRLEISAVLFAVVAVCLPLLLTGGIHMDGYMDTVDALASHQSRERKLEIMKDSHSGAFAILYCGIYLLLQFGLFHEICGRAEACAMTYVFSRALSALCAVTMPNARKAGMLCAFTEKVQKTRAVVVLVLLLVLVGAGLLWAAPVSLAWGLLAMLCYRHMAMKQFGGITGDTAGFFLQICELAMLAGVWMGGWL